MAKTSDELIVELSAKLGDFEKSMAKANRLAFATVDAIEKKFQKMDIKPKGVDFSSALGKLAAVGVGAGSIAKVKQFADAWTEAGNKLQAFDIPAQDVGSTLNKVTDIADRSRSSFSATADLYTKLTQSSKELGLSQNDIARITETVSKSFSVSGAGAQQASAGILQLSQALGSGVLQGDEFKSLMENAPDLMNRLAKALDVPKGKLKDMASEGELTSGKVIAAIQKMAGDVDAAFKNTTPTLSQAFAGLETQLIKQVGNSELVKKAMSNAVGAVLFLKENLTSLGGAAFIGGAAMLAAYSPALIGMISATATATWGLTAAMLANPMGAIAVGIAAAAAALFYFKDSINPIAGELATLGDYASALWNAAKKIDFSSVSDGLGKVGFYTLELIKSVNQFTLAVAGVEISWNGMYTAFTTAVNNIIASFFFLGDILNNAAQGTTGSISDLFKSMANGVINTFELIARTCTGIINTIISGLNKIPLMVQMPMFTRPNFDNFKLEYSDAGKIAAGAFTNSLGVNTNKFGKGFGVDLKGASTGLSEEANRLAKERIALKEKQDKETADRAAFRPKATGFTKEAKGGGGEAEKPDKTAKSIEALEKELRETEALAQAVGLLNHEKRAAQEIAKLGIDSGSKEADRIRELTKAIEDQQSKIKA
jgi:tape measure domain-containing protein